MSRYEQFYPKKKKEEEMKSDIWGWVGAGAVAVLVLVLLFAGIPIYRVWSQGLAGKAELARAEQNRQIQVEQAKAEKDSAVLRAEAIKIVGQAAKDYPEYRYQEFLGAFAEALQNGDIDKLIFVPTEAQIPITEATRTIE